jgi:predicted TIM-barrel fold metal-dependent hydrolase
MTIVDFHARLLDRSGEPDRLLRVMDERDIGTTVVCAGGVVDLDRLSAQIVHGGYVDTDADNARVLTACAPSQGRQVPFYFANPHAAQATYEAHAGHYRGLELSPAVHGVGFDDPRTLALVEIAAANRHPVYTVCLPRPGARTSDLVALARRFPGTWFVSGHCGFITVDTAALAEVAPQPNIAVETSGCFGVVVRRALDRLGTDRVLFGTEYPLQHPATELAKLAALDLSVPVWRAVTRDNAQRLLGGVLT